MVKYYIQNLDKFLEKINCKDNTLINIVDKNIIELKNDTDKEY